MLLLNTTKQAEKILYLLIIFMPTDAAPYRSFQLQSNFK